MSLDLAPAPRDPHLAQIIKLAVMAVGGQGGGVLAGWIEDVARASGYTVQATSVAGVAQRTGATIYYLEMAPASDRLPVFALLPAAGDVDILIAAELMEAGRAIIRGFVTPDRTTLIASTHRALAVSEKTVPGDGIANADEVRAAAEIASQRLILADMEAIATATGSVISASLLGALAASGALPFPRTMYEAAITAGGKGTAASLRAFAAAYDAIQSGEPARPAPAKPAPIEPTGSPMLLRQWQSLTRRIASLPAPAQPMARAGLQKVVEFQDVAYGSTYLDTVQSFAVQDRAPYILTTEAAKYIANAMAYDDVIRTADLKTSAARLTRIHGEMGATDRTLLHLTEFMHPRAEEVAGLLPARLGARTEANPKAMALLDRLFNKGRRLRTDRLPSFLVLYALASLRGYRRKTRRHAVEMAHMAQWLATAGFHITTNPDLAAEILRCHRLIKGYSDTHARGLSKFDKVIAGIETIADRPDAADWARRLCDAALLDEKGVALDGALQTIRSFA